MRLAPKELPKNESFIYFAETDVRTCVGGRKIMTLQTTLRHQRDIKIPKEKINF
jgi:hypothetical protein